MSLFASLNAEAGGERRRLVIFAAVAGAANVLILASLNASAHQATSRDGLALLVFLLLVALYAISARQVQRRVIELIETLLHRIKVRVGDLVVQAELAALERERAAELCDLITENATLISDRASSIAGLLQSVVILLCAGLYLIWLSLPAFGLLALVGAVGAAMFVALRKDLVAFTRRSASIRVAFLDRLMDLVAGFKELKFSRRRARELGADVLATADDLRVTSVRTSDLIVDGMLVGEGVLFALLAVVVYVLHAHVAVDAWTLTHLVAAVMFLWGPLMALIAGLMPYARSNTALMQIRALERRLERAAATGAPDGGDDDPWAGRAAKIETRGLEFRYAADDASSFHVGPFDLSFAPGEIVFLVGGNGSGKSTLLKVLTGLYTPSAGELLVGGVAVGPRNVAAYRDMISAIFADFHLFPRLYGLADAPETELQGLLTRMRLIGKTAVDDGAFTALVLSTGQKKRLAMVVALLERRQICVFDEWAADQDPEFREHFYAELLPRLRAEGKIVVVVSHDDRYFHCADRVIKLDYGQVQSIEVIPPPAVPA